jgi:hypothetical protein
MCYITPRFLSSRVRCKSPGGLVNSFWFETDVVAFFPSVFRMLYRALVACHPVNSDNSSRFRGELPKAGIKLRVCFGKTHVFL